MTTREILFGIEQALGPSKWEEYGRWWRQNVQKDEAAAAAAVTAYQRRRTTRNTAPIHDINKWLSSVYESNSRKVGSGVAS